METLVITIMLLVALGFVVKLSFHSPAGIAVTAVAAALFVGLSWEAAISQSSARISGWLEQPDLMLDTSVLLTIDVAMQFAFCLLKAKQTSGAALSKTERISLTALQWIPGLLIFPVLFMLLVSVIFSMTGHGFATLAWTTAGVLLLAVPLMAFSIRMLLPDAESRMELIFLINALIAITGIIATVNGRTAVAGTSQVEAAPLAGIIAIMGAGTTIGLLIYRYKARRRRRKSGNFRRSSSL